MRTKVTIALLLLNAVLFYYIYTHRPGDVGRGEVTTILGPEAANIQTLTIERPADNSTIRIERRGENWQITAPVDWPANPFAVKPILMNLQTLRSETSFSVQALQQNGQTLADYGLETPTQILTFTPAAAPGETAAPVTLKIGTPTQTGNRLYILSPDGQRVHVVLRSLADALSLTLDTLRVRTLFTIPTYEARSLNIETLTGTPPGSTRTRFHRDADRWNIEAPIQARASKRNTELAISNLGALKVARFLDTPEAAAPARATLTAPAGPMLRVSLEGNNRTETLLIGGTVAITTDTTTTAISGTGSPLALQPFSPSALSDASEAGVEYYAQLDNNNKKTDAAPSFTIAIPATLIKTLRDAQQTLRERRILDIDPATVTAITITAPSQPEVTLQNFAAPGAASWNIVRRFADRGPQDMPADPATIKRLLDNLARLTILDLKNPDGTTNSGFVNDAPSDAQKESYGFTAHPAREVTLTFAVPSAPVTAGSGTTAIASAPPPPPVTLQIGDGDGHIIYARRTGQNFIYRVPSEILNDIPTTPTAFRDHLLRPEVPGAQITAIKITNLATPNAAPLLDVKFPLAADAIPDTAQRNAIENLKTQLIPLRAKTFVADDFSDKLPGTGDPWPYRLEATIALGGGGTATAETTDTMTLFIAPRSGGTTQYIGTAQYHALFEAEQPLIDALHTILYTPRDGAK